MQRSTERILTTHCGSLPRPRELERLMLAKAAGEQVDDAEVEALVPQAVAELVARQAEVGLDVVGDGEAGKVGFCNYVEERLSGLGGTTERTPMGDLLDYPELFE